MPARFDSSDIVAATRGEARGSGGAGPITANNQTPAPGEWFVALAGDGFDDHHFVPEAAARGAAGAIVERDLDVAIPMVRVPDTWQALRDLGRAARRRFAGPVVGITGSTAKTTTRRLTALALGVQGPVHQNEGNSNADPGVALTLLTPPDVAWAQVVELGAHTPGSIARYTNVCEPSVRIVTHIGPAHLETLENLDGVSREKGALLAAARPDDIAVINVDDPRVRALPVPPGVRTIGVGAQGEVALISATMDPTTLATRACWRTPQGTVRATLGSPAPFVAGNAAIALAVAWALDLEMTAVADALTAYTPMSGRMRPVHLPSGAVVWDDTFNANPHSMTAALDVLATLPGRRVAVLADMAQLGPTSEALHRQIMNHACSLDLHRVIAVGSRFADVAPPHVEVAEDPSAAAELLRPWVGPGDHVLLKGSRTAHLETMLDQL